MGILQLDSGPAFPWDTVSSFSMTRFGAQHRPHFPRSTAQYPYYIIPGGRSSTQRLPTIHEDSSFRTDAGVDGPSIADQRRFTGILNQSPPTTPNIAPSTQLITSTLVPDLTSLIIRRSPHPISCGAYGDVYQCTYRGPEGDVEVAVKAMRPGFIDAKMFRRELGIWKRLRHSHILKFMGIASDFGPSEALVAPWMTNGTLTSFLRQNNKTLRPHDRLLLLRDIAAGLNYLHTFSLTEDGHTDLNPVVHGDLTGTNVLIDGNKRAYLADFGLSGTYNKLVGMTYLAKMSCRPGAVRWTAPEILLEEESASAASDMYSFGSVMLQVLTGDTPWCHISKDTIVLLKLVEGNIHPRPDDCFVTGQQWNFMTCCWSATPIDRPPAKEAVQFVDSALCTSTSPQTPTSSISIDTILTTPTDYAPPSTSSQTPTLSISSDKRHSGIARSYYLPGNADARKTTIMQYHLLVSHVVVGLPVMQDIDSPLDTRGNYPGVMLPAYPFTTSTTGLEPSWTQSNLPRPHTSDFPATYHTYFPDGDDNNVIIPSGYLLPQPNNIHHNWLQRKSLRYYMRHVLRFLSLLFFVLCVCILLHWPVQLSMTLQMSL